MSATPWLPTVLLLLPLALACGDEDDSGGTGDGGGADGGTADGGGGDGGAGASWAEVESALDMSCAFSSCHGGGQFPDLRAGESHAAVVGVASEAVPTEILVVPGDADASYLVAKIEGAAGIEGEPMPEGLDAWDADKIALVRAWIDAGAGTD